MALGGGARESWLFNSTIGGIENADVILMVGVNPRLEAPVLNARLRKRWVAGALRVGMIGEPADLTYAYDYLGAGPQTLSGLAKAKGDFVKALKDAKAPPSFPTWEQVAAVFDTEMEKVAKTGEDPGAAMKTVEDKANSIGTGA